MVRPGQVFSALSAAVRNPNIRRVELAWWRPSPQSGRTSSHSASSRTSRAARQPSGSPGLCACCRRRSSPRSQRRSAIDSGVSALPALTLVGSLALGCSSRRCFRGRRAPCIRLRSPGRACIHSHQAHAAGSAAVARTNSRRAHRFERCNSTIESPGTLLGPLLAGVLVSVADVGLVFAVGAGGLLLAAVFLSGVRIEGGIDWPRPPTTRVAYDRSLAAGFRAIARQPKTPPGRGADRHAERLRPRLPQCPDRRRRIPGLRCRRRSGRLHDSRHRSWWPGRSSRSDDAWRATTCCRLRPRARVLGSADRAHLPLVPSRAGDLPACDCRCCQQRRGCRRLHPAPANCPG